MNRTTFAHRFRILRMATVLAPTLVAACSSSGAPAQGAAPGTSTIVPLPGALDPEGTVPGHYGPASVPQYNGGPILTGTINIYPVFYGTTWNTVTPAQILTFLNDVGSTSYWRILQNGYSYNGAHPGNLVVQTPMYENDYAHGTSLTDTEVHDILNSYAQAWFSDVTVPQNAILMLFTDDATDELGVPSPGGQGMDFCAADGGWHWNAPFSWIYTPTPAGMYQDLPYAWVGSVAYCVNNVVESDGGPWTPIGDWNQATNGLADSLFSAAFHEIAESVTDPLPDTGWAPEIGDYCAWVPGPTTFANGLYSDLGGGEPYASSQIGYSENGGQRYLIQSLWDPTQNACAFGPASSDCPSQAAACGSASCGTVSNGCGGTYTCGVCTNGAICSSTLHTCVGGTHCPTGEFDCNGACVKSVKLCP